MYLPTFRVDIRAATLVTALTITALLTACSSNSPASSPQALNTFEPLGDPGVPAPNIPCRFFPQEQAEIDGRFYSPLWGPIRSDMIRVEALTETGLEAIDNRECPGTLPENVYEITGVPVEQVFAEIRHTKNSGGGNRSDPLACHFKNHVYTFTAVGAEPPPPPFGRPTQEPWSEGSPTPVPVLTESGPLVELSPEGLLAAGWPGLDLQMPDGRKVYWDSGIRISYQGREYRFSGDLPLWSAGDRLRVPIESLDQVDIVFVQYLEDRWPEGLASAAPHLLTDGEVEDRIKLYRILDRPAEEVIIIDPCPTFPDNLQPDNIMFWGRISAAQQ